MRSFLAVTFLITGLYCKSQSISKADFVNVKWCTDNSSRSFYKSDTVKLYRIIDTLTEFQNLNIIYRNIDYNKGQNFTSLILKKRGKAEIIDHDILSWSDTKRRGKWSWKYDDSKEKLSFYFDDKPVFSFLIIGSDNDQLIWEYEDFFTKKPVKDVYHIKILKLHRLN